MTVIKNGVKWYAGKWQNIKSETVKNKNNSLYDYVIEQQKIENQDKNDFNVNYFKINNVKITIDDLYCRYGMMGFDLKCEEYPEQINCYTDVFSIFDPVYCELDEYGERLRIWKTK